MKKTPLMMLILLLVLASCKDDTTLGNPDRMFRPVVNETTFGGDWIRYVWESYQGVEHYELELSTDSFASISNFATTDTSFYTFEDLEYDTNYLLRIKCVGKTEGLESKYFIANVITTEDYPTQLANVTSRTDTQVKIEWIEASYDSLVYFNAEENTRVGVHLVTETENKNGWAALQGLKPESSYIVRAYSAKKYQGKKTFSTRSEQTFATTNVVDHRGLSPEEAKVLLNADYFASLAAEYPNGDVTIVLEGGMMYDLTESCEIAAGFTMTSGYSLWGSAILKVSGELNLASGLNATKIKFDNIEVSDHPDKPKEASNFGGGYFFNLPNAGYQLDSLLFEGCTLRYKRGLMRNRVEGTINTITFNNCFVDSIGGYNVIDFNQMTCKQLNLTNSTIAHTEQVFRTDKLTTPIEELNVQNITFAYVPKGYIFRSGNATIKTANIKNCIFSLPFSGEGTNSGFYRSNTSVYAQDNFATSDCEWRSSVTAEDGTITEYAIESEQLTTTTTETFKDPSIGDYSLIVSKLKNKAGDPRWW